MSQPVRARIRGCTPRSEREKEMNDHATILDPTQLSAVQSQRCTHMIYRNKYSVHFYLPCLTFVTTSGIRKYRFGFVVLVLNYLTQYLKSLHSM